MSVSAMANLAIGRRHDYPPVQQVPRTLKAMADAAGGTSTPDNAVTSALNVIVAYIPTEILTLYVATLAAIRPTSAAKALAEAAGRASGASAALPAVATHGQVVAFWAFLAATPVAVWILYASKLKIDGKPLPLALSSWPLWEMAAGTICYAAWAAALPENPFTPRGYSPALSGLVVLITATVIGLVAPLFQSKLGG